MLATIFFLISVFIITYCTWSVLLTVANLVARAIAQQSYKYNLNIEMFACSIAVTYAVWYLMVL